MVDVFCAKGLGAACAARKSELCEEGGWRQSHTKKKPKSTMSCDIFNQTADVLDLRQHSTTFPLSLGTSSDELSFFFLCKITNNLGYSVFKAAGPHRTSEWLEDIKSSPMAGKVLVARPSLPRQRHTSSPPLAQPPTPPRACKCVGGVYDNARPRRNPQHPPALAKAWRVYMMTPSHGAAQPPTPPRARKCVGGVCDNAHHPRCPCSPIELSTTPSCHGPHHAMPPAMPHATPCHACHVICHATARHAMLTTSPAMPRHARHIAHHATPTMSPAMPCPSMPCAMPALAHHLCTVYLECCIVCSPLNS
jgi:hypothetical protein